MAISKRNAYVGQADRAGASQLATVDLTVPCELGNHAKCPGTVLSLTASNGASCLCDCHDDGGPQLEGSRNGTSAACSPTTCRPARQPRRPREPLGGPSMSGVLGCGAAAPRTGRMLARALVVPIGAPMPGGQGPAQPVPQGRRRRS
jgi:hypothetical protein